MSEILKKIKELNNWYDEVPEPWRFTLAIGCTLPGLMLGRAGIIWLLVLVATRMIGHFAETVEEAEDGNR